jgi:hypothetical protein
MPTLSSPPASSSTATVSSVPGLTSTTTTSPAVVPGG